MRLNTKIAAVCFATAALAPVGLSGQAATPTGTWHLWSIEGVAPAQAPVSRSEQRLSRREPEPDADSISVRFDKKLLDRTLEVFPDGTFRIRSVEWYQQSIYAPDVHAVVDSIPPWLADITGFFPVRTQTDTVTRIGEWSLQGDSILFRLSYAGLAEDAAERFGGGDRVVEAEIDAIVREVLGDAGFIGVGRIDRGRMHYLDKIIAQELVMSRGRRW
jgi:hypothetical protein